MISCLQRIATDARVTCVYPSNLSKIKVRRTHTFSWSLSFQPQVGQDFSSLSFCLFLLFRHGSTLSASTSGQHMNFLTSVALPRPMFEPILAYAGQQGWLKGVNVAVSFLIISYNWQISLIGQNFLNNFLPLFSKIWTRASVLKGASKHLYLRQQQEIVVCDMPSRTATRT